MNRKKKAAKKRNPCKSRNPRRLPGAASAAFLAFTGRQPRTETDKRIAKLMRGAVVVYPEIKRIVAVKGSGRTYFHDFQTEAVPILGLRDGSILIPRQSRRLWGRF